jgi:hypothetical protein
MLEPGGTMRTIRLRAEVDGKDKRFLDAFLDEEGRLCIDGQDLGPGTALISSDGEYEWSFTYAVADLPRVSAVLDGQPGEDVLDVLERWVGRSYELEKRLRESGIPSQFWSWSG